MNRSSLLIDQDTAIGITIDGQSGPSTSLSYCPSKPLGMNRPHPVILDARAVAQHDPVHAQLLQPGLECHACTMSQVEPQALAHQRGQIHPRGKRCCVGTKRLIRARRNIPGHHVAG